MWDTPKQSLSAFRFHLLIAIVFDYNADVLRKNIEYEVGPMQRITQKHGL